MKTVKYIPEVGCKVKVGGIEYSGDMVIPIGGKGLADKDIERLLKDKFIRKIELNEGSNEKSNSKPEIKFDVKQFEKMSKEELQIKAKELGIDIALIQDKAALIQKIMEVLEQ